MSEVVSSKPSKTSKRWLHVSMRILVAVFMFIVVVGLILNVAILVGVWVVRASAYSAVTDVTSTVTHTLVVVNNGLGRVNTQVQDGRLKLTQVNDAAANLGNRIETSSPLFTKLNQLVNNDLAPRLENVRTTSSTIHDAVVSFNSALVALDRLPGVTVPTLSSQLSAVSDRAQDAQAAVQDLRTTLAGVKTGVATTVEKAITNLTTRIDAPLAQIQDTVNKYQGKVTNTQDRFTSISNRVLLLLNLSAVLLTLFLIIIVVGHVLLLYVCWQYVRRGRFPTLRVVIT
jgi:hypothetical protein